MTNPLEQRSVAIAQAKEEFATKWRGWRDGGNFDADLDHLLSLVIERPREEEKTDNAGLAAVANDTTVVPAAQLSHAAPELYASLRELLCDPNYQIAVGGNPRAVDAMLRRANNALAKAEGRKS